MQVDPRDPAHINTKECPQVGTARCHQWDMAAQSALALCQQFTVHGDLLERVKVFRYLGRLRLKDEDDIQAIEASFARHVGRGHGLDRYCGGRMRPHE